VKNELKLLQLQNLNCPCNACWQTVHILPAVNEKSGISRIWFRNSYTMQGCVDGSKSQQNVTLNIWIWK